MNTPTGIEDILTFWFGRGSGNGTTAEAQKKLWWAKDAVVDAEIRERYGALVAAAAGGAHREWARGPRGRLALILLFDQFPRNIYRDTPQAFAHDGLALRLALDGIVAGADRELRAIERVFFYLPLEHSESVDMQERSVALFTALAAGVPEADRGTFAGFVDYAVRHRDIVHRFGRFPHRNRILGRESTAEEIAFLEQPGSSF
ncbi:MAG: DUF924 domain-containing protein [Burkholderiales bacterium]|nr:DUF924 domain-containing protein [Burkholderiales bacterium]